MTPRRRQDSAALVATDAAIGMTTVLVRACGRITRGLQPIVAPVLRPENWPIGVRTLAETGSQQRRRATTGAVRMFRKTAPAVVTVVLDELDLVGIVRDVIDKVELPEIIRASTGSVADETVRDARVQLMAADDVVARWAGRVLRPRSRRAPRGAVAPHDS